jgi:endonuclease/exonuclease/phosphatase family metal-dependent hydrolase
MPPGGKRRGAIWLSTFLCSAISFGGVAIADSGRPDVAGPAVIATGGGKLEVFIRGENNELVQRSWNGAAWSGWKNLGGDLSAAPAVTSSRPGRLDVFVRGAGGDLVYRFFQDGHWSGWNNLGGDLTSAPAAVSPATGRIDVFVRGAGGELVQRTYRRLVWGGWRNLAGRALASAPSAAVVGPNRIEVFARGRDFHLLQRSFDGSQWSDWRSLGGDLSAGPAATATGPNELHVLVRGLSGELVHRVWNGSSWSGWMNLGGELTAAPAAAADRGRIDVFMRGTADNLVQRSYAGGRWGAALNLGGQLRGRVRARLRLLTHNVYGLPGSLCEARARRFGTRVATAQPAYDIVGVQEYYNVSDLDLKSCDAGPLSKSIWSTGRYRNSDNYYRFYPEVSWKPDGGVGIFTLHQIVKFDDWQWNNDGQGFPKAAEGFVFARIRIPSAGISIDTYVVHLNSGGNNFGRRRLQLEQLRNKIVSLSRESGNPILIMGDFNIGGPPSNNGNSGYPTVRSVLARPQDIWMDNWPRENGWTYDCVANTVAAGTDCESRERIDYLIVATDPALTTSPYLVTTRRRADVSVVRWRVDREGLTAAEKLFVDPGQSLPHVSDHWGLEAVIELRDR